MVDATSTALRIVERLGDRSSGSQDVTHNDILLLQADVESVLGRRWPRIANDRRAEWAMEAVQRFLIAASKGQIRTEPAHMPRSYLRTIGINLAVDEMRRPQTQSLEGVMDSEGRDDERILRLFDEHASKERVLAAIARSREANDKTAIRVVIAWMRLAEEPDRYGDPPSARAVADVVGLSHTGVLLAMERFRGRL